jgi:hypothetical protein
VRSPVSSLDFTTRSAMRHIHDCTSFANHAARYVHRRSTAEFDTFVFTAGTEPYASPLLDKLDPAGALQGRRYRQHCRQVTVASRGGQTQYLKDLVAVTGTDGLARCVLVDNNPMSFVSNPSNGIPVPVRVSGLVVGIGRQCAYNLGRGVCMHAVALYCDPTMQDFVGEPDSVLPEVLKLLRHLAALDDVRPTLRKMFQLPEQLAPMRQMFLGNEPEPGLPPSASAPRSRL